MYSLAIPIAYDAILPCVTNINCVDILCVSINDISRRKAFIRSTTVVTEPLRLFTCYSFIICVNLVYAVVVSLPCPSTTICTDS